MTTSARVACALLGLMGLSVQTWPARAGDEGIEAKAAFDRLKTLKGEWKSTDPEGHHGSGKVIYSVTAAGTTLMETQFPGTGHEMVTMYHLDGGELRMTHYCAAGNQPRLKFDRKASTPDVYSFVFDGGTNLDPAKDMHIHGLRIKFLGGDKIESEWDGYEDGKFSSTSKFPMSRQ